MVIDYKGVTFSFKEQKRKQFLRKIRIFIIIVALIGLYLIIRNSLDAGKIKTIQELMLANKGAEASEKLKAIEGSFFHKGTKKELEALLLLAAGNRGSSANARAILESLGSSNSLINYQKFLDYFSDRAQYRELKIYTTYLLKVRRAPETSLSFYKAMYNTAMADFKGSITAMGQMSAADKEKHKQELAIIAKTNNDMKTGRVNYIFDVNGKPLAYYDLPKKKTISETPGMFFDTIDSQGDISENLRFFSFTLDRDIQEKIHYLFKKGNLHGSFLLINLNDGSIAAAYSNSLTDDGKREEIVGNSVFSQYYEPGSIIKLITLFAYLQSGGQGIFTLECDGSLPLKDNIFYDWIKHKLVKNYEEALMISCNICFARMGLYTGEEKLISVLKAFYFNNRNGGLKDRFFTFNTGTFTPEITNKYQLANLSVGLNEIAATTFHAALIPAIIAQNGTFNSPYLIKNEKNLLNLAYYNHPAQLLTVVNDTAVFSKIKEAMIRVVEDKRGTGRRAKVDFVRVAIKTGTAGNRALGLDAIMSGFFPTEKPQYAFGFRLQGVGQCEYKGALFLKDFLTSFYGRK